MRILVVIPTYNEKDNLGRIAEAVLAQGPDFSILVVDDNSPDGTGALADDLARRHADRIAVIHRSGKLGLGSAYLQGFRHALEKGFEAACEMDADGSHDPADLPRLAGAVAGGADLAIGSRRIEGGRTPGWGFFRNLISRSAMRLTRLALGLKTADVTAGFRCYNARALELLLRSPIRSGGYSFQEEALFYVEKAGLKVKEIPVVFRDREFGRSKLNWREVTQFFATVWRLRG